MLIWKNTFFILEKYIFQFGQIHLLIWKNWFVNLEKYIFQFGLIHFAMWTNTFCSWDMESISINTRLHSHYDIWLILFCLFKPFWCSPQCIAMKVWTTFEPHHVLVSFASSVTGGRGQFLYHLPPNNCHCPPHSHSLTLSLVSIWSNWHCSHRINFTDQQMIACKST